MPYEEKKRERRIRDLNRMKAKSQRIFGTTKYANDLCPCSCPKCGSGRKWYGRISFTEERAFQSEE